ncbi:hypothetical protein G6F16_003263 [Rhizopus arrhizus]|nr:hypothetical protein G6F21_003116 [Rhizopus arrhizus]KAG0796808.1 hypothetical protein G6F22_004833 [Rhizopus arrhizus]KAG0819992.1 hypothetical protein G6F20_000308 [Rhizopus arrhizus]KAG0838487.1 hypothetical protein G6F19_003108 [Rhizopus arrhizus]KAG0842015.1 hypothetical protein G6F18_002980 [Rhizopus arrhizus]
MCSYCDRRNSYSFVTFLDIKAVYDTVNRHIIWKSMFTSSAPFCLISLLANHFDDISVSVLLQNNVSTPFPPSTCVLQGSVPSPHLYSIYINKLPALLHSTASSSTILVLILSPSGPPDPGSMAPPGFSFGPSFFPSSPSPS